MSKAFPFIVIGLTLCGCSAAPFSADTPFDYLNKLDLTHYTQHTAYVVEISAGESASGNPAKAKAILDASRAPANWVKLPKLDADKLIASAQTMVSRMPIVGSSEAETVRDSHGLFTIDAALGYVDFRPNGSYHNVVLVVCKTCLPHGAGVFILQKGSSYRREASSVLDASEVVAELNKISPEFQAKPGVIYEKN